MPAQPIHHAAYACRDINATVDFYENVMGFPLVHAEVSAHEHGFHRHIFFDLGDGSSMAFFDLHGVGEEPGWSPAPTGSNGQPVWVTHVAFRATEEQQQGLRARAEETETPVFDLDHGWCQSVYAIDPNGIMVEFCRDTPGFVPDREQAHRLLDAVPTGSES